MSGSRNILEDSEIITFKEVKRWFLWLQTFCFTCETRLVLAWTLTFATRFSRYSLPNLQGRLSSTSSFTVLHFLPVSPSFLHPSFHQRSAVSHLCPVSSPPPELQPLAVSMVTGLLLSNVWRTKPPRRQHIRPPRGQMSRTSVSIQTSVQTQQCVNNRLITPGLVELCVKHETED